MTNRMTAWLAGLFRTSPTTPRRRRTVRTGEAARACCSAPRVLVSTTRTMTMTTRTTRRVGDRVTRYDTGPGEVLLIAGAVAERQVPGLLRQLRSEESQAVSLFRLAVLAMLVALHPA